MLLVSQALSFAMVFLLNAGMLHALWQIQSRRPPPAPTTRQCFQCVLPLLAPNVHHGCTRWFDPRECLLPSLTRAYHLSSLTIHTRSHGCLNSQRGDRHPDSFLPNILVRREHHLNLVGAAPAPSDLGVSQTRHFQTGFTYNGLPAPRPTVLFCANGWGLDGRYCPIPARRRTGARFRLRG